MKVLSKLRAKYLFLVLTSTLITYLFYTFKISKNVFSLTERYMDINGEHMNINGKQMNIYMRHFGLNEEQLSVYKKHKTMVENHISINEEHPNIHGKGININDEYRDTYRWRLDELARQKDILVQKEIFSHIDSQHRDIDQQDITQSILLKQLYSQQPLSVTTARPFPAYRRVSSKRPHWTPVEEFAKRKRRLDKVCSQRFVGGQVHGVYTHSSGVIYCYVPKAGCTFWKRVFTASHLPPGQDPFRISRNNVHFTQGTADSFTSSHHVAAYPTRLLVVRDPFSRLLSSYLDKIYLPDFWPHIAQRLILARDTCSSEEDFMRSHFDRMTVWFDTRRTGTSTCNESGCVKYLTFSEFVRGALVIDEPHWAPIHQICNPCAFRATHVAYMQSFNQDARPILHQMGMEHILDDFNHTEQINQEIEMLIDYHFSRIHNYDVSVFYQGCITPAELAYRLWQTFQWKGYIDPEMTYQLPNVTAPEDTIQKDLVRQVLQARKSGLAKPENIKAAAKRFREMAYRSVPKDLFENLLVKYYTDFELFGYKQTRNMMYSEIYNGNYDSVFRS